MQPTKLIPLTQGKHAIVDADDYERIIAMGKWTLHSQGYAYRWDRTVQPNKCLLMHRVIAGTPEKRFTDHINGNKLDNRRSNLRSATPTLNSLNRQTRGAYIQKSGRSYSVELKINGHKIWIGRLHSRAEAQHIHQDIKRQLMEVI